MKILGVDSSGMVASVALVQDDITVAEYSVNYKKTHSQTLLPMLDEIIKMTEQDLAEIDAIAVAAGPGSFTGLRIGAATVKGLGMALEKPVVAVPTCHALAYNLWGTDKLVCPIMDARRSQVYTGIYEYVDGEQKVLRDQDAMDIAELTEILMSMNRNVIFLGDGVPVYRQVIEDSMPERYTFAPAHMNRQRAAAVAALGGRYYAAGIFENADEHKPVYLRKSQAEREREEGRNADAGK
ncbi:MAG: tRNA (adenosine(37)-N6)-threonylcarbamoyltransferase complex dimerization subunit type 1 TsaB [Wujia sp.]